MTKVWLLLSMLFAWQIGFADIEADPELSSRYHSLSKEIRCVVCQNQSIAESNSELAQDLRAEVARLLLAGATDAEVLDFMRQRYGDFVQYRPPWTAKTLLLWTAPFFIPFLAFVWFLLHLRKLSRVKEA